MGELKLNLVLAAFVVLAVIGILSQCPDSKCHDQGAVVRELEGRPVCLLEGS
jgi:hypothetical protein